MIDIKNTDVFGWEAAIRGMRNPLNSWAKSDSEWDDGNYIIGTKDLSLMKSLSKAGSDHSKFLRMINVTCDITAPLYWWKEYDTYKVSTVANSCSTMHKIQSKPIEVADFSFDVEGAKSMLIKVVDDCEFLRQQFVKTKNKNYWRALIQLLPSSYNQKRTVQLNYQVLKNMYFARKNHKLDEWRSFCEWCETLPYFKEIING
jgi:hypothetical protein